MRPFVVRFIGKSGWFNKAVERMWRQEVAAIASEAAGTIAKPYYIEIAANVTAKFLLRVGTGSVKKLILSSPKIVKWFENWIQKNADKLDPSKPEAIATAFSDAIADDPVMQEVFEVLIKDNMKSLETEICGAFRDEIKKGT